MISFNHIGNLGRLANQMFQYASLKGIAMNRGYDFYIPPRDVFGQKDDNVKKSDTIIYNVFDLESNNNIGISQNNILMEKTHTFDEELFNNCPDNVDLFGYYQSEKYFKHVEYEIRKDFTFKSGLFEQCQEFINSQSEPNIISLHVRRSDYVINENHPVQSTDYYSKALTELPKNIPVIIFSDDPEWCKKQSLFESDRFLISENNTTDFDLCLMSMCNYHIIANSSFSWWGAWLAKSEKIIAPKKWFAGECVNKSVEDMSFGNWIWL